MRLGLHQISNLSVSEEDFTHLVYILIKDKEVLILIVSKDVVINQEFPCLVVIFKGFEVFFISKFDIDVENLLVDSCSLGWMDATLGKLDEERLIILLKKSFS